PPRSTLFPYTTLFRSAGGLGPEPANATERPGQCQPGRPDERGSDVGLQKRAETFEGGGGNFRDHARGYPTVWSEEYTRLVEDGAGTGCGANQRQHMGDFRAGIQLAVFEQAVGADRRASRVHADVRRRELGHARRTAGGY